MSFRMTMAAAALAVTAAFPAVANAALFTDRSVFGGVVENFQGFQGLVTSGPQSIAGGAATLTATTVPATVGAAFYDLGTNGQWGAGNRFALVGDELDLSATVGSITLSFSAPVYGAGFLLNHFSTGTEQVTLEALGVGNVVLETYTFGVTTPGTSLNAGAFYGIGRIFAPHQGTPDMVGLRISGDGVVFDDLRITTSPVPSPTAYALLLAGLGGLGVFVRRGRKASA